MLSYNEAQRQQLTLRHLIWPDKYGFISEAIIAIVALVIFNVSALGNQLSGTDVDTHDAFSYSIQPLNRLLDGVQQHMAVQQVLLFLLWAVVGGLIYILVFRLIQIFLGVRSSVGEGMQYVQQEHARGIVHWLDSLHGFFVKVLIAVIGTAVLLIGAVVCFGLASQELNDGLTSTFPMSLGQVLVSFLAALLAVRLIVLGLSLLSRHFRNWYTP